MNARRGRLVVVTVGLLAVAVGAAVGVAQSGPSTTPEAAGVCPRTQLPPISGHVTDMANARAIERVATIWLELQQTVLVVKTPGSTWPCTNAVPMAAALNVHPVFDSAGHLGVNSATEASMVSVATAEIEAVNTQRSMVDHEYWIRSAISQATNDNEIVGAGNDPTSFTINRQTATTATVTVQTVIWEHWVYPGNLHPVFRHTIFNKGIDRLFFVRSPSGHWLVNDSEFGFVPGYGP